MPSLPVLADPSEANGAAAIAKAISAGDALRAPAATVELREPASPRLLPLRAGWQRLKAAAVWLDDSWVGDLIGAACLFGSIYIFTLIAWALLGAVVTP